MSRYCGRKASGQAVHVDRRGWYVVCDDFRKGPYQSEKEAELRKAAIDVAHCSLTHEVIECV